MYTEKCIPGCGRKELFWEKVRDFLDTNGPQPAIVIAETGVSLDVVWILKQGRVEILMAPYILSVRDVELI